MKPRRIPDFRWECAGRMPAALLNYSTLGHEDPCRGDVKITAALGPDGKVQPMFPRIKA